MRLALTAPMWSVSSGGLEKEGIPAVMQLMNDYCLTKDDHIALLEMTRIKARPAVTPYLICSHAAQAEGIAVSLRDPESLIPTAVKSAFTRACNDKTRDVKSGILLPEFKKGRKKKATPADEEEDEEVRHCTLLCGAVH